MKKTLAIIGAGQLGLNIANHAINDGHYTTVVFFDDFATDKKVNNYHIIGKTNVILSEFNRNTFDELIIGIGYNHLEARKKFYDLFCGTIPFGKIIHSTSWVDKSAIINDGCVIYPHCCIDSNVEIKANTIVNIDSLVAHDTVVGKHCFLSARVALAGFVMVEEQCFLGISSTVIENIKVSAKIHLGAGTVVIKDLERSGIYVGNPHRFLRPVR